VTIHSRVAAARERLRAAGIPPDEADLDARLLAEHVLGWDTARFFSTAAADPEPAGFEARYCALVARRAAHEPISYIVRQHEFWGLPFEVSPAVLIPRPETELVVEIGLEIVDRSGGASRYDIADVCTGSGCLAVVLAHERPTARVVATDISAAALEVARRNAARHEVNERIRFLPSDLLEAIEGSFDLIVANPPYVRDVDRPGLQPEVRDHEPAMALFAGPDGLDVIRRLAAQAPPRLKRGASLVFEIGFGQADAVERLISSTPGLTMVGLRPDLQGIPRVAVAKRSP
jgi:release factor glutamine methyltransferase